jgi:hypothetical protein
MMMSSRLSFALAAAISTALMQLQDGVITPITALKLSMLPTAAAGIVRVASFGRRGGGRKCSKVMPGDHIIPVIVPVTNDISSTTESEGNSSASTECAYEPLPVPTSDMESLLEIDQYVQKEIIPDLEYYMNLPFNWVDSIKGPVSIEKGRASNYFFIQLEVASRQDGEITFSLILKRNSEVVTDSSFCDEVEPTLRQILDLSDINTNVLANARESGLDGLKTKWGTYNMNMMANIVEMSRTE